MQQGAARPLTTRLVTIVVIRSSKIASKRGEIRGSGVLGGAGMVNIVARRRQVRWALFGTT
jgi:hypothetical protein